MKDKHDKVTPDFPEMEGDYNYRAGISFDAPEEAKALREAYIHQTVRAFEDLMKKHGLDNLLGQMSTKGAHELLKQAVDLEMAKELL